MEPPPPTLKGKVATRMAVHREKISADVPRAQNGRTRAAYKANEKRSNDAVVFAVAAEKRSTSRFVYRRERAIAFCPPSGTHVYQLRTATPFNLVRSFFFVFPSEVSRRLEYTPRLV